MILENNVIKAQTVEDAVEQIMKIYIMDNDVCLGEFLEGIEIAGLSISEVMEVYARLYENIEDDKIFKINIEEETIIQL